MCWLFRHKKRLDKDIKDINVIYEVVEPKEETNMFTPKKTNRRIDYLVVHCTATRENQHITVDQVRGWHMRKGWSDIGYHYLIYLDGTIKEGRPIGKIGAHVRGFNKYSIGISYVGGVNMDLAPKDTRTHKQKAALKTLLIQLKKHHPNSKIQGHRDFSPDKNKNGIIEPFEWMKACPSFDALEEYKYL